MSMVWTFGQMALEKEDIQAFFLELIRFTIFTGFFWWLLTNGPEIANAIINSLRQIAGEATGLGPKISPSSIMDIGFEVITKVINNASLWSPPSAMAGLILGGIILFLLTLISVNVLILICSGWILAYAGVFFLGFGGSRWTTDIAINYYKTVLGLGARLFTMIFIIGIGKNFLDDYYTKMQAGINLQEMFVLFVVVVILYTLTDKIPALLSGVITGASIGSRNVNSNAIAAGAAAGAIAATNMSASMIRESTSHLAGGAKALGEAVNAARKNMTTGNNVASASHFNTPPDDTGLTDAFRTISSPEPHIPQGRSEAVTEVNERPRNKAGDNIVSTNKEKSRKGEEIASGIKRYF